MCKGLEPKEHQPLGEASWCKGGMMRFESREEASVDLRRPYCPATGSLMDLESCSLIVSVPASCVPRGCLNLC